MSSGRIARNSYIDFNGNIQLNNYQALETTDKYDIYFSVERGLTNKSTLNTNYRETPFNLNNSNSINYSLLKAIEVHNFLITNKNLTNNQKLDYCQIGRYFMKAFLKEIVRKY
jgi:hypothetical protein